MLLQNRCTNTKRSEKTQEIALLSNILQTLASIHISFIHASDSSIGNMYVRMSYAYVYISPTSIYWDYLLSSRTNGYVLLTRICVLKTCVPLFNDRGG